MPTHSIEHSTIVVERVLKASAQRVFAAWSDVSARRQWDVPGDEFVLAEFDHEFRIGGTERSRFGPPGDPRYWSAGHYLDIVEDVRIISAGTMHEHDVRISTTLCTVEFSAQGSGCRLVLTDQSGFLDGHESPRDRSSGWGKILERLALFIETDANTPAH